MSSFLMAGCKYNLPPLRVTVRPARVQNAYLAEEKKQAS